MKQTGTQLDAATLDALRERVARRWFEGKPAEFWDSDDGKFLVDLQASQRYLGALDHVVPWVDEAIGLAGRKVVEVGSGTGSSAAAFGHKCGEVQGFEIEQLAVDLAAERFRILGVDNATVRQVPPQEIDTWVRATVRGDCVVLLYAVLEHMTVSERLSMLQSVWGLLEPGGAIVVIETPNRLSYMDRHSSRLPFFNMLPLELAAQYFDRSPRSEYVRQIQDAPDRSMCIQRWGRGVSYHEFELAFGLDDISDLIVRDGYEDHITGLYPLRPEDRVLREFFEEAEVGKSRAFTRNLLNFVIRKP